METTLTILNHERKVANARRKIGRLSRERYYFDHARTDSQRAQSFALRYRIFCLEEKFLPDALYPDGQQTDEFDALESTRHMIGFCSGPSSAVCGTVRVIRDPKNPIFAPGQPERPGSDYRLLPLEMHYSLQEFRARGRNIEQVSSLAFKKGVRQQMYFGLCKCIYLDAVDHGIDDIFIQANPFMAWLFEAIGFKKLYSDWHAVSVDADADIHYDIPVVGMHLDMTKINNIFLQYFSLNDPHFLFQ